MFPPGWPGLALLLLRTSVAMAVLLEGFALRQSLPGWAVGLTVILLAAIFAGFLTPLAALLAIAFHLTLGSTSSTEGAGLIIMAVLNATALAMLGPGAYSIDARRFGRRVVVLPPND